MSLCSVVKNFSGIDGRHCEWPIRTPGFGSSHALADATLVREEEDATTVLSVVGRASGIPRPFVWFLGCLRHIYPKRAASFEGGFWAIG